MNLIIANGLYLCSKRVATNAAPVVTEVPTDHIVVIDCSGSMYGQLPQIRQQLKNKLPMMMREADSVSIIWFSGKNQCGVVVEGVAMRTATDLSGVHRAIDNFLKPMGLTGFVDPLQEVEKMVGRVQKPGRAVNLFFMSDGCDNQWSQDQILKAVEKLQPIVSSAAVVEYGYYCNKPLMVKISERLGASEVLAENFLQYEPIFESAMTKKVMGGKKIEVRLDTSPLHGFAFTLSESEIITFGVDGRSVLVPEGVGDIYWFSELPTGDPCPGFAGEPPPTWPLNVIDLTRTGVSDLSLRTSEPGLIESLYAGLVPLTQRMLSTDIFRVLKAIGDVRLIHQFANCFGKQAYQEFQRTTTECVFTVAARYLDGYNPDEVPAEDAFTVLDLLYELAGDEGNLFYPSHEAFHYERIGRKAIETDGVLSASESERVAEIAKVLGSTSNPATIVRLQKELSELVEGKKGLTFVADSPNAGYPVSSLVLNEDRPNISAQVHISGVVDLTEAMNALPVAEAATIFPNKVPVKFPTKIVRNYTIVRDGIRNVRVLPVSLTKATFITLTDNGVVGGLWTADRVFEIDLTKIPLINRKMVKSVSAKELFQKQHDLLVAKSAQKVLNYFYDQNFPPVGSKGFADSYGADAATWLASLGIKDYGFSPKVELAEATESYYGKELTVSIAGLSSLPTVKSVVEKAQAGKKLTAREAILAPAIAEVDGFLRSSGYQSVNEVAQKELLSVWLTNRKRDTIMACRKLMREMSQIKFSVIVGQVWFQEFASLDDNTLTMTFDGQDITCSANLNEIEIKV